MKKYLPPLLALGLALSGAAISYPAFAQSNTDTPPVFARGHRLDDTKFLEHQAEFLGVSVDVLKAKFAEGKNMKQIMSELGITAEQLTAKLQAKKVEMEAKIKEEVQAKVTAGELTQAQADLLIAKKLLPRGHGFGHRLERMTKHKHGPHKPFPFGLRKDKPQPAQGSNSAHQ